ncbi:hypothetical protein MGQ_03633 [Candida albicans P76067]|nr:hypothetical protein MGO_03621 [Candida albicans P76055]KHC34539.1 hypothetical protein MGQ_03633 [Candida albicans P76067]
MEKFSNQFINSFRNKKKKPNPFVEAFLFRHTTDFCTSLIVENNNTNKYFSLTMQMMHSIYTNYDDCICCHHRHRRINQNNGLVESVFMITLFFYFNINSSSGDWSVCRPSACAQENKMCLM